MTTVRALVRGAVSHPAVCALPYELDEPTDETMVALVVAKAGALDVFELAKTTPDEAMLVALDQLRFFHDLWRGHSTLAQAMVAIAAENIVLDRAALALGQTPVAWSNVEVIIHELDTLIASVPSMGEMLMGESIAVARDLGLDVLAAPNSTDAIGGRTHDNGASVLQMMRVLRERWASSCPVTASLRDCRTAFESLPEVTADAGTAREEMRAQLVKPGWTAETRRATRDKLVAMDREAFEAGLVSYADKLATPLVRLAVLRFQLEVTARKVCPTPDQLRAAPWKEILAPAPLGDTLRSDKTTTGYTLRAPAWMAREKQSWTVSCATESP
jgi:hypothetical protein